MNMSISRSANVRSMAYWVSTACAALALGATGAADLTRVPAVMEGLAHLGYPPYFATILGTWELLGALAILLLAATFMSSASRMPRSRPFPANDC